MIIVAAIIALPIGVALVSWLLPRPSSRLRLAWPTIWLVLATPCAQLFYVRYWIWRDCFNELGRCFDEDEGVLLEQVGVVWGGLLLIFGLCFVVSLCRAFGLGGPSNPRGAR